MIVMTCTHAACASGGAIGAIKATQATSHAVVVTVCAARPVIAARAWRRGRRSSSSTPSPSPPPPP